ncbi:hypothetical protein HBH56_182280 [Parastagonospora nodorum]|uniref:Uncharacterized protein n=2 Tax=Phaeosphaeria nodorum (strain SN15 / ATCC MYA-4574 / FGSC 10173) TaxID=321614 RepID=A0A7U2FFC1_PHANO|nr:hypothetical protein SNOG_12949 [Parastagonospora nodorum SN15]KAH3907884.1 hypothetical protein HBH56_182280 [Parastagonospora nodorum]EAT79749.1 hypothetical protein SNOG_12949 [Parastagonospora nodorum SN15]KAH3925996.1 hypothetical protein HBH54_171430 [Parastagonospora nodorum]KAH4133647.1 hypothetical protein HBH45_175150 [Parastagonospora nodorum]KAH4153511.1 hypothetical protein HBH44_153000 [Parastagonospora nodorum]
MAECRVSSNSGRRTRSSAFEVGDVVEMKVTASVDGLRKTYFEHFVIKALRHTPDGYWEYQLGVTEDEDAFEDGTWYPESSLKFDI